MSRTITMAIYGERDWDTMGLDPVLNDSVDGQSFVMERPDGFEISAGEAWTTAENVTLADGNVYHVLFQTTYCNYWAPWTSESTHATLYRVDDPDDMEEFRADVAEWEAKPELDPDYEDQWGDDDEDSDDDSDPTDDDEDSLTDVDIPDEFLTLASDWHSGQNDLLYAVASTGGLTLGSIRPRDDDDQPMTDRAWHVHLWESLACDIRHAIRSAEKSNHDDLEDLRRFEQFAESTAEELRAEYGLGESDPTDPTDDSDVPNLDGMSPGELREWSGNIPASIPYDVRGTLAAYAICKADAMENRASGHILMASDNETMCDRFYAKLPEKYRW